MAGTSAEKNFAAIYDQGYKKYDLIVNLFQLGLDRRHRLSALQFAGLKKNDTVLDICCGSGLSIEPVLKIIGSGGKIIAIDANDHMLDLAKKKAEKNKWHNITFIKSGIDNLSLDIKADMALFGFCWYDRKVCTGWVHKVAQLLKPDNGTFCFIDHKFPENWVKNIAAPVLSALVKWLGESYNVDDMKWNPKEEIGTLLTNPKYRAFYFDSIFTICGKPKENF